MKQISIYPVIVKSKVLADGSHKVRIAVSHNNSTRYLPTRFNIPSEKNFRNGEVVNMPTANSINRKLREMVSKYYDIYDTIPNAEILSCSQIVDIFKDGGLERHTSLSDIAELWIMSKGTSVKETTIRLYRDNIRYATDFFGKEYNLSVLSPLAVIKYVNHLRTVIGLNNTTINIKMGSFRCLIGFAKSHGYVQYAIDPFIDYKTPPKNVRRIALTIDQLRKLRDAELTQARASARDYFMFSFYNCGINIADVQKLDISKDTIRYRRTKTENRRGADEWTEFTMQPEARAIADKSLQQDRLVLHHKCRDTHTLFGVYFPLIREEVIPDCPRLIYYSARKTFAQLAAELNVPDGIIEYCIGDKESQKTISFYRHITKEMADCEIRKVFDFVASDMSLEQWREEYYKKK